MTPTIVVEAGRPVLALGGSGGTTIAPNVTQVLLAALVFDQGPAEAVQKPRIEVPTQGATLLVEEGTPPAHVADSGGARGNRGQDPLQGKRGADAALRRRARRSGRRPSQARLGARRVTTR